MVLNRPALKIPKTFIRQGIARPGSGLKTKRNFHLSALILKNKKLL